MGRMDGKVAIVTGAASQGPGVGNGKAMAILFAREGAKVVLVNRKSEHAEELRAEIEAQGGEASVFSGDVTSESDVAALGETVMERYGRLDVLVSNVGIGGRGKVEEMEVDSWDKVIDVNVKSAMLGARMAVPLMRDSGGGGSIINISSVAGACGLMSKTGAASYAVSKTALHGLTWSIAADYAAEGIRCNCIIIGSVATPMVAHFGEDYRKRRAEKVPLQVEGTAWDIGHAAVYLASDESRWVTGVLLPVDGGLINLREWPQ